MTLPNAGGPEDLVAFVVSFAIVWGLLGGYAWRLWRMQRDLSRSEQKGK